MTDIGVMDKKKPKSKKDPNAIHQVLVRMPYWLFEALEKDAEEESRTVNMHIVWLAKQRVRNLRRSPEEAE